MDKITIYILSIIVALVFGWAIESHAQIAFANDSYHTSFMSTTFDKGSDSFLSSNSIQQDTDKKGLTTFEKILNVPIGIIIGSLCGAVISYGYYFDRVVKCYDIDFSVGYINTSILLNFKISSLQKFNFYVSLGPSFSIAVHDATKFHFLKEEDNPDDFDFSYIMDEPNPLFGYPAMVYRLELQRGKWIGQLGFHHSVTDTDEICPLISKTRLRTLELNIGYKL